ncbi:MAG: hypothetical protein AB1472_07630, partial [Candidatus Omnitrophota bacterium]
MDSILGFVERKVESYPAKKILTAILFQELERAMPVRYNDIPIPEVVRLEKGFVLEPVSIKRELASLMLLMSRVSLSIFVFRPFSTGKAKIFICKKAKTKQTTKDDYPAMARLASYTGESMGANRVLAYRGVQAISDGEIDFILSRQPERRGYAFQLYSRFFPGVVRVRDELQGGFNRVGFIEYTDNLREIFKRFQKMGLIAREESRGESREETRLLNIAVPFILAPGFSVPLEFIIIVLGIFVFVWFLARLINKTFNPDFVRFRQAKSAQRADRLNPTGFNFVHRGNPKQISDTKFRIKNFFRSILSGLKIILRVISTRLVSFIKELSVKRIAFACILLALNLIIYLLFRKENSSVSVLSAFAIVALDVSSLPRVPSFDPMHNFEQARTNRNGRAIEEIIRTLRRNLAELWDTRKFRLKGPRVELVASNSSPRDVKENVARRVVFVVMAHAVIGEALRFLGKEQEAIGVLENGLRIIEHYQANPVLNRALSVIASNIKGPLAIAYFTTDNYQKLINLESRDPSRFLDYNDSGELLYYYAGVSYYCLGVQAYEKKDFSGGTSYFEKADRIFNYFIEHLDFFKA